MVSKRYMQKYDTCIGYGARIKKLLLKKPPGIMSAGGASSMCEQSSDKKKFYKQLFYAWSNRTQVRNLKF